MSRLLLNLARQVVDRIVTPGRQSDEVVGLVGSERNLTDESGWLVSKVVFKEISLSRKFKMNKKSLVRLLALNTSLIVYSGSSSPAVAIVEPSRNPGLWCQRWSGHAVTKEHEMRLAQSLRRVTGFADLRIGADGSLALGDSGPILGGSEEGRRILINARCSDMVFIIEDYSRSGLVNFGQVVPEQVYESRGGRRKQQWRVRLDFDDFDQMEASSEVRAAFDEGFTLLHELLHGLGYEDASRERELGACEEIVNRIRSELGLPLRVTYFGEAWRVTEKLTSVRLGFRSGPKIGSSARGRPHYLFFLIQESADYCDDYRAVKRADKGAGQ